LVWVLGGTLAAYVVGLYALSFSIQGRIQTNEDFLVAGRRLSLPLATGTILATWFGAGTVLTAADEVRHTGLEAAALEPFGAGACLVLAGLFLARRIWEMKLLTLGDLFRSRFGRAAEMISALIMVPSYFGWVAAQFVALAAMLHLFFGLEMSVGIALVALVGTGYTLLGGMWSVTLTDAFQMVLVLVGLVILGASTLAELGGGSITFGLARLWSETPQDMRQVVPVDGLQPFVDWMAVLAVGSLGNLPSQDLVQRISASRSSAIARRACIGSGVIYIVFGLIPVTMGLAGSLLFPDSLEQAVLPALAHSFTQPVVAVTFTVMLASAVLSSIDSGILAPASVLSENLLKYAVRGRLTALTLNRVCVLIIGAGSLAMAYAGASAYELLEDSYGVLLVSLFVPMVAAVYGLRGSRVSAIASMLAGLATWVVHRASGWEYFLEPWTRTSSFQIPVPIAATLQLGRSTALLYRARWPRS
jgi:Na+/proline symporter